MLDRVTRELLDLTATEVGHSGPRLAAFLDACCCSSCCTCLFFC